MHDREETTGLPPPSTDVNPDVVDQLAELIESNLDDVSGAGVDFKQVTSHFESSQFDELDDE